MSKKSSLNTAVVYGLYHVVLHVEGVLEAPRAHCSPFRETSARRMRVVCLAVRTPGGWLLWEELSPSQGALSRVALQPLLARAHGRAEVSTAMYLCHILTNCPLLFCEGPGGTDLLVT